MMKKVLMGAVACLAAVGALTGSSGEAEARSVSASLGGARLGTQAECFFKDFATGAANTHLPERGLHRRAALRRSGGKDGRDHGAFQYTRCSVPCSRQ